MFSEDSLPLAEVRTRDFPIEKQ